MSLISTSATIIDILTTAIIIDVFVCLQACARALCHKYHLRMARYGILKDSNISKTNQARIENEIVVPRA